MALPKQNTAAFDRFIEYQVQFAIAKEAKATDEFAAASRWLSGALFGLNGGAIAALLQLDHYPPHIFKSAATAYLVGISSCFFMVILSQCADGKAAKLLNERGNRLVQLLDPNIPLDLGTDREAAQIRTIARLNLASQIAGAISLIAFLVGCWTASTAI